MTVCDTQYVVRYPHDACRCLYCICVLVSSVHWVVQVLPLNGTDAFGYRYEMYCGLVRWLLAYGLSVIILTSVPCTIGRYVSMSRLCSELIESSLHCLESVRLVRALTVLRSLAADGLDNCPSVRLCAGLIDLCRAGLGCALRILIDFTYNIKQVLVAITILVCTLGLLLSLAAVDKCLLNYWRHVFLKMHLGYC